MNVRIFNKRIGSPCEGFTRVFSRKVQETLPMVAHREPEEFYLSTVLMIQGMNRWEYLVEDDAGNTTALMVLYDDHDMHVGRCLSVLCAFSTDPHALFGGYKWLFSLAKGLDYKFLAYTKVVSDFEMTLKYKKVQ